MSRWYVEDVPPWEERLEWYRKRMNDMRAEYDKLCRMDKEYCDYLVRWFGNGECDGTLDYEHRILYKRLPMPYNVYMFE